MRRLSYILFGGFSNGYLGYRFLVTVKSIHFAIATDIVPNITFKVIIHILMHYFIKNSDQSSSSYTLLCKILIKARYMIHFAYLLG